MLRALSLGGVRLGPADRGSFGDCDQRGFLSSRGVAGGVVLGLVDVRLIYLRRTSASRRIEIIDR